MARTAMQNLLRNKAGIKVLDVIPPAVSTDLTPDQTKYSYIMLLHLLVTTVMAILRREQTSPEVGLKETPG